MNIWSAAADGLTVYKALSHVPVELALSDFISHNGLSQRIYNLFLWVVDGGLDYKWFT